jgi:predicted acyl esterase
VWATLAAVSGFSRGALLAVLAFAAALLASAPAGAFSRQEATITSADGTRLAATLALPDGPPPPGGWPAVVYMHGLGGNRAGMLSVAQAMGIMGERYAVLAYDARGHGDSGGLVGIDGPKEIADVRAVFGWLRDRPEVADARIGGWGVSYGGGAAWNSLAAGVPWAALEISISWTDLLQALAPQGLAKTGVITGFLSGLDPKRVDPEVVAIRDAAFRGDLSGVRPFAAARSSISALKGVRTPVFLMQGRRDFAFGLDQAKRAYAALAGPKKLWIGLHGHAPSSAAAADTPAMLTEGTRWFDRFLRGDTAAQLSRPVAVAPERWRGRPRRFAGLPKVVVRRPVAFGHVTIPAGRSIGQSGRYRFPLPPRPRAMEVFGSPTVEVTATTSGGWSRIVAVLSARTPAGREIVVAGGGVPARPGTRTYRIALSDQATFLPRGSRLTLTIGSSSLAQSAGNLLYLDLPFPSTARLRVTTGKLRIPELSTPISG